MGPLQRCVYIYPTSHRLTKQLEHRHVGTRPTINDQVIQHLERLGWPSDEAFDLLVFALASMHCAAAFDVLPTITIDTLHEDATSLAAFDCSPLLVLLSFNGAVDRAGEPHAKINPYSLVNGMIERVGVAREIKVGQESERAQCEGNNRRDDVLK